jgi:tRNA1(Val) A37 N6-methylase TrmN6
VNCVTSVDDLRADGFLGGRLTLRQPARGHRAGTDAVLLAAAAPRGAARIADLGCGVGSVGLALLARETGAEALLVEVDPALATLAAENADANGLAARCRVIVADLLAPGTVRRAAGLTPHSVDLVMTNPPFGEERKGTRSPDEAKARAHVMPADGLDNWVKAAADLSSPEAQLVLIHRPEALAQLLAALEGRFGSLLLKPVHPREGARATRLLIRARKGGRAPPAIAAPLVLHGKSGRFTALAEAIHRGEADIDW